MKTRIRSSMWLTAALAAMSLTSIVSAAPPEIAHVWPSVPELSGPRLIVGESFDTASEVWVWRAPVQQDAPSPHAAHLGAVPVLPAQPPSDARKANVLDAERQVLVADGDGDVLWVKNGDGFSTPVLLNVPQPFWLSEDGAYPGDILHVYGFGLRGRKCRVVLKSAAGAFLAREFEVARSPRWQDRRLVYFEVPKTLVAGDYAIFLHNDHGGEFGWVRAGKIRVADRPTTAERIFNVRDFGAKGDDAENDFAALRAACDAAAGAGGGVVFLPAGVYRTDETISVPQGVTLRGASRQTAVIQGYGYDGLVDRVAWFAVPTTPPASVVRLANESRLESLTVEGMVGKGAGGAGLVEAVPSRIEVPAGGTVSRVRIRDCLINANEEEPVSRRNGYQHAMMIGPNSFRVDILDNEIFGAVSFQFGTQVRAEIINNKIHGGTAADVVALNLSGRDCLIDANLLVDAPGRMVVNGSRCHVRYNEIHHGSRATWTNAEEGFLVHGGSSKSTGRATAVTADTLTDTRRRWHPDELRHATVLIISGRGFGQYRTVLGNDATTVQLDRPWRVTPDATSEYVIGDMFVENCFFGNQNIGPYRLSLWLECIANVVDHHRDAFGGGLDLWGQDTSKPGRGGFNPAYYNVFTKCWVDGAWINLWTTAEDDNVHAGPATFGTLIAHNKIKQPHTKRTGFDFGNPGAVPAIKLGNALRSANKPKPPRTHPGLSHTLVANNLIAHTEHGVIVSELAWKSFLLGNDFQAVSQPIVDWGGRTVARNNRFYTLDSEGEQSKALPAINSDRDFPPRAETAPPPQPSPRINRAWSRRRTTSTSSCRSPPIAITSESMIRRPSGNAART